MKLLFLMVLLALGGCAHLPGEKIRLAPSSTQGANDKLALFSGGEAERLPQGWTPWLITRTKKPTQYRLQTEQGRTVLHARAEAAASGLMQELDIDPARLSQLDWHWKIERLINTADNYQGATEDSPVRIVLAFDGDKDVLPFADQMMFETGKLISGRDIPYATLMYIWENKAPVGTVINNSRSGRIKMVVAASGGAGIGQWRHFSRNIADDFQAAFGEKPGRLIGLGVMTDTDNTGESVEAWYGDIRLIPQRKIASK
jgi:hypothetical protein